MNVIIATSSAGVSDDTSIASLSTARDLYETFDSSRATGRVGSSAHDALHAPPAPRPAGRPSHRGAGSRCRPLAPCASHARRAHGAARAAGRARRAGEPHGPAPGDLNHAGAAELVGLPGVGPALAARIVAAREANGPFGAVDDLRRVRGLPRQTIERLRAMVRITE
ncbi:MAG: hypothetical protein DME15_09505 [Candidatus Rokuibacteriota bacterium]|nr:MAG: hypothetical protein DME15_09505 [Candidatus Rokubacteria bacterium]